jgi:hypothetical protein
MEALVHMRAFVLVSVYHKNALHISVPLFKTFLSYFFKTKDEHN